jgi:predicted nucleic acid-binding Zn ribbon protein
MPENLPDHAHCLECEAAMPFGRQFCSDKCESTYQAKVKRGKNKNLIYLILALGAIVSLGLFTLLL